MGYVHERFVVWGDWAVVKSITPPILMVAAAIKTQYYLCEITMPSKVGGLLISADTVQFPTYLTQGNSIKTYTKQREVLERCRIIYGYS